MAANTVSLRNNSSIDPLLTRSNASLPPSSFFNPRVNPQKIKTEIDDLSNSKYISYPIEEPKFQFFMHISKYSRQSITSIGNLNTIMTIALPMPTTLVDSHSVRYEEEQIGSFLGSIENATGVIRGTGDAAAGAMNAVKNLATGNINAPSLQDLKDGAAGIAAAAGRAIAAIPQGLQNAQGIAIAQGLNNSGALSNIIRGYLGYTPNQFMTILLRGPQYKRHEFSWKFSPKNPAESRRLSRIIKYLLNSSAVGTAFGGALWAFPKIFQCGFHPNPRYLFKFKPAVVESITPNYSGSGIPAFLRSDAITHDLETPESIELRMVFLELEYWLSGDYNDNNNHADTKPDESYPVPDRERN